MKNIGTTTQETIPSGTTVRHIGKVMEGTVRSKVNPARVAGRTDCVWVWWGWGLTAEVIGELERI